MILLFPILTISVFNLIQEVNQDVTWQSIKFGSINKNKEDLIIQNPFII
jgi:uncharacterized protein (UPF0333 family)